MFLQHTSQYRSLWYSVHLSLCLGTLWEDLLNCLKRSYYLAVLSLVIFYNNYVSDFCTKLFTACESAKANLSFTQKFVEEKYDADIVE